MFFVKQKALPAPFQTKYLHNQLKSFTFQKPTQFTLKKERLCLMKNKKILPLLIITSTVFSAQAYSKMILAPSSPLEKVLRSAKFDGAEKMPLRMWGAKGEIASGQAIFCPGRLLVAGGSGHTHARLPSKVVECPCRSKSVLAGSRYVPNCIQERGVGKAACCQPRSMVTRGGHRFFAAKVDCLSKGRRIRACVLGERRRSMAPGRDDRFQPGYWLFCWPPCLSWWHGARCGMSTRCGTS